MTWVDNKNFKHIRYQGTYICDKCLRKYSESTESNEKD